MKKNYDFSSARPNPYAGLLKRPVTIRLDRTSIEYFKAMAEAAGIPYQSLINLYLRDCVAKKRKLNLTWK
jgi:predicted DNA binding CopG/RHH family protein